MANRYQEMKEKIRAFAIEWQLVSSQKALSLEEITRAERYFEKFGRRYGLLKEFHENGIC